MSREDYGRQGMSSWARAPRLVRKGMGTRQMGTAAGIYGLRLLRPQLWGAMEGSPRWAVARDEMLAETPRDIHLPQGIVDYQ